MNFPFFITHLKFLYYIKHRCAQMYLDLFWLYVDADRK